MHVTTARHAIVSSCNLWQRWLVENRSAKLRRFSHQAAAGISADEAIWRMYGANHLRGGSTMSFRSFWRTAAALLLALALPTTSHAADLKKVLRTTFMAAETGFDPVQIF